MAPLAWLGAATLLCGAAAAALYRSSRRLRALAPPPSLTALGRRREVKALASWAAACEAEEDWRELLGELRGAPSRRGAIAALDERGEVLRGALASGQILAAKLPWLAVVGTLACVWGAALQGLSGPGVDGWGTALGLGAPPLLLALAGVGALARRWRRQRAQLGEEWRLLSSRLLASWESERGALPTADPLESVSAPARRERWGEDSGALG